MTQRPLPLFVNPVAGRGRARRRIKKIENLFHAAGVDVELNVSGAEGDLERRIREKVDAGSDRIVVVGGDGSIHEAVNGIMRADSTAALGVIPSGTGNDFAKGCSIPLDWQQATELLASRVASGVVSLAVDLGRMNGRYFANGAGIGFDAKVTKIARSYRWPVGDLVYLLAIFRAMLDGIATPEITIRAEGIEWQGPVTLANVSNGPWIGGMFHIAPMAVNNDGLLDLLIAAPVSGMRILRLLPKLMRGEHANEPEIRHATVERLHIDAAEELPSHLDGEVRPPAKAFDIDVLPGALRLL